MTIEAMPNDDPAQDRDADELRNTLFRTLSDLRAGRITAQEAKAVTTTVTNALFGLRKAYVVLSSATHTA
jgi:hypothetical protein